ncbi:PREDICTED: LOC110772931 isoform [Prunus dulcis]|uniref:PREDICTED: LOC110772931 isoform n=1 Tax=Prunus dulcis TaxID=3755 RepID=A0A5E4FQA5_PRUDU|nr:PREDICTED: LOC110772931 isoform [Prunus dulcis]
MFACQQGGFSRVVVESDSQVAIKMVKGCTKVAHEVATFACRVVVTIGILYFQIELKESDKQEVDVKALQADLRRLKKDVSEYRNEHEPEVDVKALQADVVRLEKELSEYRKPREQVQTDKPSAVGNQKSKL